MVITNAQLYSTKAEVRLCAGSNRSGNDLWKKYGKTIKFSADVLLHVYFILIKLEKKNFIYCHRDLLKWKKMTATNNFQLFSATFEALKLVWEI